MTRDVYLRDTYPDYCDKQQRTRCDVTPDQFRALAMAHGWKPETVALLLRHNMAKWAVRILV